MKISGNTILITGGSTGIGFALAKELVALNNIVIIAARTESKLQEAKRAVPQLITKKIDVGNHEDRIALYDFCTSQFPNLNMIVNNAGIQREVDFKKGALSYWEGESELAVNLEAVFHLTALFTPHLLKKQESAIVNVSSGLGLVPLVVTPIYSATKAALHSFSISLRRQLANTSTKVFEVLPPIVDTDLDKGAREKRGQKNKGIPASDVAVATLKALEQNQMEVPVGMVKALRIGSRIAPGFFLNVLNK